MANVRLFAALRELAGTSRLEVEASDVEALLAELSARLGPEFDRIMVAGAVIVDGETAPGSRPLDPGDEVALLPPVSGG
jgi:MoaD family protein